MKLNLEQEDAIIKTSRELKSFTFTTQNSHEEKAYFLRIVVNVGWQWSKLGQAASGPGNGEIAEEVLEVS